MSSVEPHGRPAAGRGVTLTDLLWHTVRCGGSDLHLVAGAEPGMRLHGQLEPIPGTEQLTGEEVRALVYPALGDGQRAAFEDAGDLDFSHEIPGCARFRGNLSLARGEHAAVFRVVPDRIRNLDELGMPPQLGELADLPRGLVLVTGPTGSGKTTSLAALIDKVNATRPVKILTVEDPIEFTHAHKMATVTQREIGQDTRGWAQALRAGLRQDPDVILVGEMRDSETIATALTCAETGHLVFATLHAPSASEAVHRIVDGFAGGEQAQVRAQLAATLQAVVFQVLATRADGNGRVAACEVMRVNVAIRANIRDNRIEQIDNTLSTGAGQGMLTLDQHLAQLVRSGVITGVTALAHCRDATQLAQLLAVRDRDQVAAITLTDGTGTRIPAATR